MPWHVLSHLLLPPKPVVTPQFCSWSVTAVSSAMWTAGSDQWVSRSPCFVSSLGALVGAGGFPSSLLDMVILDVVLEPCSRTFTGPAFIAVTVLIDSFK